MKKFSLFGFFLMLLPILATAKVSLPDSTIDVSDELTAEEEGELQEEEEIVFDEDEEEDEE